MYTCKYWLVNKICSDSSKFVNAEIELSGADNETRIGVPEFVGEAKVTGAALDSVRFDLKVFAEIEFSGTDNETRIVVPRIIGEGKVTSAVLDSPCFNLKVLVTVWPILSGKTQHFSCGS